MHPAGAPRHPCTRLKPCVEAERAVRLGGIRTPERGQGSVRKARELQRQRYSGKCRLNNARNAAGFTGLAR